MLWILLLAVVGAKLSAEEVEEVTLFDEDEELAKDPKAKANAHKTQTYDELVASYCALFDLRVRDCTEAAIQTEFRKKYKARHSDVCEFLKFNAP